MLEMLTSRDGNIAQAVVRAGYPKKTAAQMGTNLLKRPHVQALLASAQRKREERTKITADYIWEYLYRVISFDPGSHFRPARDGNADYFEISTGGFEDLPIEVRQMIEGAELRSEYNRGEMVGQYFRIKMVSKSKCIDVAARHGLSQKVDARVAVAQIDWSRLHDSAKNEAGAIEQRILLENTESGDGTRQEAE